MTDERASGMEVPAARMVRPITASGIPRQYPIVDAHHTMP
eukprot:CAMPEP_0185587750 /NCGR_PEP_ID=MMETSP0434-20130131/50447_1 /TAXON_ID=626734 ORGANISM="Favella taraikaensis, Strain Fe Narragansett Bay" /NCGR_SAMPLE_ID=MMETSP0434 /ASSEMBLY_ACC=CAM_ASM_000379 /LENGTH=39 /DNA_ID= /DNA_START= /DNA_END= /DNA_ORIENTATION=